MRAAAGRRDRRRRPHVRPAAAARRRPGVRRVPPRAPVAGQRPCSGSACSTRSSSIRTAWGWGVAAAVRAGAARGGRRRRARHDRSRSGCSSGGSRRASTRCGARSCGATSCSTSSTRCWVCRGSRGPFLGTPIFNAWARTLGVKIGKGVWLESYWLPETDLVRLDDGVDRQPRLRAADPPVPRPAHADQLRPPRARCLARPDEHRARRDVDRRGHEHRPGFARDARRVRAGRHPVGGKPDHRRGSGPGFGHRRQEGRPTKQGGAPAS